jgi:hypothetical protein
MGNPPYQGIFNFIKISETPITDNYIVFQKTSQGLS